MKDKARLIDTAKNCLIALLIVSALFLLYKAVTNETVSINLSLKNFFGGNTETNTDSSPTSVNSVHAANPVFLMTTSVDGSHYAVKYDSQSKDTLISQFSADLGEALGTSGSLREISEDDFRNALKGSGVFFDYLYPAPLSALASWLGTEVSGEAGSKSARRLFLGDDEGNLILYFYSEGEDKYFSSETALSFSSISGKIAEFPIGNANFAFESGDEYKALDPYFIFSRETDTLRSVQVSGALPDNNGIDLLRYFGMNKNAVSDYFEADGSVVYVDGEKTLRIESSGEVIFSVTGNEGLVLNATASALTIEDCISTCYEIAQNSIGLKAGDGVLGLVNISGVSTPSSCTVSFGYFVDGIPVTLPYGGYAASFHISDGAIVRAELNYRAYTFSGGTIRALPEKLAAEIAKVQGGEPVLTYEDTGSSVSCTWINN